jgi:proteasome alpha subunit
VRYADVRGYSYDREDVTARGLASVYAQSLGAVFTAEQKPFEVELAVAEVGSTQAEDHLYRLTFDGSIADEHSFVVMGGQAERVSAAIDQGWRASLGFPEAVRLALNGLAPAPDAEDQAKPLPARALEIAVLYRHSEETRGTRRAFHRLNDADITALLA